MRSCFSSQYARADNTLSFAYAALTTWDMTGFASFIQGFNSKYKGTKNIGIILYKLKFLSTGSGANIKFSAESVCLNFLCQFQINS